MKRYAITIVAMLVAAALLAATAAATEKRNEHIVPKEKIVLLNGKDFTGWKLFIPDKKVDVNKAWSVRNGVIHCEGKPKGYMRTEADYAG